MKADRDEASPYAAMLAAQDVAVRCKVSLPHPVIAGEGGGRKKRTPPPHFFLSFFPLFGDREKGSPGKKGLLALDHVHSSPLVSPSYAARAA